MKQLLTTGLICLGLLAGLASTVSAIPIHESATLGPIGVGDGPTLINLPSEILQFLGSRFSLSQTMVVDHIGGHIAVGQGLLFGVIVGLTSSSALPTGSPFDLGEVLASTTFVGTTSPDSEDLLTPLTVTLAPGDYAVIFGTGLFGAAGVGLMPDNNTDIPGNASYFRWAGSVSPTWIDGGISNTRFVVTGNPLAAPVPEPSTILLLGLGLAGVLGYIRWVGMAECIRRKL